MPEDEQLNDHLKAFAKRIITPGVDPHQQLLDHLARIDREILNIDKTPSPQTPSLIIVRKLIACVYGYIFALKLAAPDRRADPDVAGADPAAAATPKPEGQTTNNE